MTRPRKAQARGTGARVRPGIVQRVLYTDASGGGWGSAVQHVDKRGGPTTAVASEFWEDPWHAPESCTRSLEEDQAEEPCKSPQPVHHHRTRVCMCTRTLQCMPAHMRMHASRAILGIVVDTYIANTTASSQRSSFRAWSSIA